ncbi:S41 family peptidase [Pedobacter sp. CFBP9032]|uniref:S41 family peptidase n=1 Tax=Pedobacter sp. CFBP9032 TaxID=3096539 RepID=UPI002A6A6297|nr:S41 family peptidase [Pedobacter sp. CFBP9032]MDY0905689.1 S41 family peptidase [Pedobacter sp. CFBP9032]
MKYNKYSYLTVLILLSISLFVACKKDSSAPEQPPVTASASRDELTKDSIFLYTKELYYWNTSLPTYDIFKPRSFSSKEAELYALTQYSSDPATGKPYEFVNGSSNPKYSFFEDVSATGKVSALKADVSGTANDYGFSLSYQSINDLRVKYVYPNSPASLQGLTRGCKITSINGRTNLSYSNAIISFLNDAIFGTNPTIALTFVGMDNVTRTVTVASATYTENPILFTNVYTVGAKKVGYLVFNSFTSNITPALRNVFANFATQGVTELIVDLRYNGGGFVSTATDMINLAAPINQNGNVMYTTQYNSLLQGLTTAQRKASVLSHQPLLDGDNKLQTFTTGVNGKFATYADIDYSATSTDNIERFAKSGSLALSRIYFIVTESTASASELVINSLKPVTDVKIIGETTYGKPVGFFPIRIDKVDMYVPEFETRNQAGAGGYYAGLSVDKEAFEDLTKAWGDETETLLSYALLYARTGSFVTSAAKSASLKASSTVMPERLSLTERRKLTLSLDQNSYHDMLLKPTKKFK